MIPMKDALKRIPVFQDISPSTYADLAGCGVMRQYRRGTQLFLDKEPVSTVFFLADGKASLYKLNHLYEKKVIFLCGPGQPLNEVILQDPTASINCEILEDSLVLCFPRRTFLGLMERDAQLSMAVMSSMALKIRRLYHQLKNTVGSVRGDKRLAAKLWKLSLDYGVPLDDGTLIDFDLSITYLAELLGSKRETVSRLVKQLSEAGLVEYRKNHFFIPDREKLMEYFKEP